MLKKATVINKITVFALLQALEKFRGEAEVVVMLASLLASGTGITVTCASEVVLMEPYWNPFVSPAGPLCDHCWVAYACQTLEQWLLLQCSGA